MIPAGHTKFTSLVWMRRIKWRAARRSVWGERTNKKLQQWETVASPGLKVFREHSELQWRKRMPAGSVQGCSFQQWWRACWGWKEAPQLPSPPLLSFPTRASIGPTQPEVSWCRNLGDSVYRGCPRRPQSSVDSGSQASGGKDADDWKLTQWWELSLNGTAAKSLQSCPTLCDPIDGSPPGSPVPGILQARTLEWVAISFSGSMALQGLFCRISSLDYVCYLSKRQSYREQYGGSLKN